MTELVARLPRARRRRRRPLPPGFHFALFCFTYATVGTTIGATAIGTGKANPSLYALTPIEAACAIFWWCQLWSMLKQWWDDGE